LLLCEEGRKINFELNRFYLDKRKVLDGFNRKKFDGRVKISRDILQERLEMTKLDDELRHETIIRVMENYILLIHLVKAYKLILKDARYHRTTTRFEQALPLALRKLGGTSNADITLILDQLIEDDMPNGHVFIRHPRKLPYPVLELDKLLGVLESVNYDSVLDELVKQKTILPNQLDQLDPDTTVGNLALQIFHATLFLIEQKQRELLDTEEAPYPPKSRDQLYSRLKKFVTEEEITR